MEISCPVRGQILYTRLIHTNRTSPSNKEGLALSASIQKIEDRYVFIISAVLFFSAAATNGFSQNVSLVVFDSHSIAPFEGR